MKSNHSFWNVNLIVFTIFMVLQVAEGRNERANSNFEKYESVNLRRARSQDEYVPPDALMSSKVDSGVLNDIGGAELGTGSATVDRKRRDRAEVDLHAQRAESDAIAAAAESAAAEADAVAAAVEVAEVENENHPSNKGRGKFSGSIDRNSDDSDITFEENDDGSNVVVVEKDERENEHTGRGGAAQQFQSGYSSGGGGAAQHFQGGYSSGRGGAVQQFQSGYATGQGHGASEFDIRGSQNSAAATGSQGQQSLQSLTQSQRQKLMTSSSHSASGFDSIDQSGSGIQMDKGYADIQAPLNALLAESSDLAKEIRMIFDVLARREEYLVQEMEKLKVALGKAIEVLEENNKEIKLTRKRRDTDDSNPYKACVYINPPGNGQGNNQFNTPQALVQQPPDYDAGPEPNTGGDEVDLSSVYWLKLPENQDEGILERVHRVLTGVRDSGKDVLLIPVSKGYMSKEDVANGFLKAVRINPAYIASSDSKQKRRRKKLRLRIRRI